MIPFLISVLRTKKPIALATGSFILFIAEAEGFEPPVPCGTLVFKTSAFDHSAISPAANRFALPRFQGECKITLYLDLGNPQKEKDSENFARHP